MGRTSNKGWSRAVNATLSLPLRWHCLWLNHLNHFNAHPFVLPQIVGAISWVGDAKIKVSMLVLISFDGWKVGMVLKSMTDDITMLICVCQIAMAMI